MLGCMASDMRQEADAVIVGKLEDGMTFVDSRLLLLWSVVMYALGLATAAIVIATLLG
jgi:hypothetical protein